MGLLPRYPVFVPSKGRAEVNLTAKFLLRDLVPFRLVVEPQERDRYAGLYGAERVLVLPENDRGLVFARNWVLDFAKAEGHARHWQVDDNIRQVHRSYGGKRFPCDSGPAFRAVEDFSDRYENVGLAGMNYHMFGLPVNPPFFLNVHVYSCTLVNHAMPYRFRGFYNEDVDMCLQVLSGGLCTVLFNVFLAEKMRTMTVKGGQTDAVYGGTEGKSASGPRPGADGRLRMARALERAWPGVVATDRRFKRPQHVVRGNWRGFDTKLVRRKDVDWDALSAGPNEYGLDLVAVRNEVRSETIRGIHERWRSRPGACDAPDAPADSPSAGPPGRGDAPP